MLYYIYYLYKYYYYIYYLGMFYYGMRSTYDIYYTLNYVYNLIPYTYKNKESIIEMYEIEKKDDWNIIKLI